MSQDFFKIFWDTADTWFLTHNFITTCFIRAIPTMISCTYIYIMARQTWISCEYPVDQLVNGWYSLGYQWISKGENQRISCGKQNSI